MDTSEPKKGLMTLQIDEEETSILIAALLEIATRYHHLMEVCELGDHDEYRQQYAERLDTVHDLLTTLREVDDDEFEVDPETGELL